MRLMEPGNEAKDHLCPRAELPSIPGSTPLHSFFCSKEKKFKVQVTKAGIDGGLGTRLELNSRSEF